MFFPVSSSEFLVFALETKGIEQSQAENNGGEREEENGKCRRACGVICVVTKAASQAGSPGTTRAGGSRDSEDGCLGPGGQACALISEPGLPSFCAPAKISTAYVGRSGPSP